MAVISVPKPHQIGDLVQQGERRKLYTYLYQLSEKLESAMQNIDSENMSDAYNKQMTDITSVSDKAKQLAVMLDQNEIAETENVRKMYDSLQSSIESSANSVTTAVDKLVTETDENIRTLVAKTYIAKKGDESLEKIISSAVEQSAKALRMEFETHTEMNVGALKDQVQDLKTFISCDENGIMIGKIGDGASPIKTKLTNERLEFVTGSDVVLAYIQNDKLHIDTAEVDTIAIGNSNDGYLDVDMQPSGLQLKWRS